jgi:hypothetical protein
VGETLGHSTNHFVEAGYDWYRRGGALPTDAVLLGPNGEDDCDEYMRNGDRRGIY